MSATETELPPHDPYAKGFYERLGLTPSATHSQIRKARRLLITKYHPDINGIRDPAEAAIARDKSARINEAYQSLGDNASKGEYDRLGHDAYARKYRTKANNWGPAPEGAARAGADAGANRSNPPPPPPPPGGGARAEQPHAGADPGAGANPPPPPPPPPPGGNAGAGQNNGTGAEAPHTPGARGANPPPPGNGGQAPEAPPAQNPPIFSKLNQFGSRALGGAAWVTAGVNTVDQVVKGDYKGAAQDATIAGGMAAAFSPAAAKVVPILGPAAARFAGPIAGAGFAALDAHDAYQSGNGARAAYSAVEAGLYTAAGAVAIGGALNIWHPGGWVAEVGAGGLFLAGGAMTAGRTIYDSAGKIKSWFSPQAEGAVAAPLPPASAPAPVGPAPAAPLPRMVGAPPLAADADPAARAAPVAPATAPPAPAPVAAAPAAPGGAHIPERGGAPPPPAAAAPAPVAAAPTPAGRPTAAPAAKKATPHTNKRIKKLRSRTRHHHEEPQAKDHHTPKAHNQLSGAAHRNNHGALRQVMPEATGDTNERIFGHKREKAEISPSLLSKRVFGFVMGN